MTISLTGPRVVVPEDAPRTVWMLERGEGVTASEVWAIARGGIKTWRRILEQKMNGSTFRGNKATKAGTAREVALLDEAADHLPYVVSNGALWAAVDNDLHRATPDGIGRDAFEDLVVIEVKSHEHGWDEDGIPADHLAQLHWQMHVLGAEHGLYGFEVRDEDDMPPADGATWIPVPRDNELISYLVYRANAFIAWRDAGCPDVDDLPEDVQAALDTWAPLKAQLDKITADEKKAAAALKKAIRTSIPHAERFGAVAMGEHGGYQLGVTESTSIDEAEWEADSPETLVTMRDLRERAAAFEARAKLTYPKTTRRESLRFQEAGK